MKVDISTHHQAPRPSHAPAAQEPTSPLSVPGTVPILDFSRPASSRHTFLKPSLARNPNLIPTPTPTTHPDDPITFPLRRKLLATTCWTLYTFTNGFASSNLYSILTPLSQTHPQLTLAVLNAGTGYLFLLAGFGLLFWQPLALQYGKRLVYVVSMAALAGMSVWGAFISTKGQWYARSVLSGFFASPIEALPESSVADLYFGFERGWYMVSGLASSAPTVMVSRNGSISLKVDHNFAKI